MAANGRRTPSPTSLLELLLESFDELFLLLDEAVLSPDTILNKVFVVEVDLMVGLRSGPRRLFTQLGD